MKSLLRFCAVFVCSVFPIFLLGQQPGALTIKGKVIRIHNTRSADGICAKYPCTATIKVLQIYNQGSGLVNSLSAGDTIPLDFVYSLHKTNAKAKLPGLSKGQAFTGLITEHKMLGDKVSYSISEYKSSKRKFK